MATEKRLIDANAIPWEEHYVPDPDRNAQWDFKKEWTVLKPVIDQMPTVDAVEVVRCKDCKFFHDKGYCTLVFGLCRIKPENDFCSHGERKDNG